MTSKILGGMIPPVVTPFLKDEIALDLFKREVEYQLRAGVDGIGVAGSTGEGATLSDDEVSNLVRVAKELTGDNIPIVAGVIRNSSKDAVSCAHAAVSAGADFLLVTPIFYHGGTLDDNIRYYQTIARNTGAPIIVYNVVPTNDISPEDMLMLANVDNVVGIKQVNAESLVEMVKAVGERLWVFSACDLMLYSTYCSGAVGTIAAILTILPDLCIEQWRAFQEGDHKKALSIQNGLIPIVQAYMTRPFPGKVKSMIAALGRDVGTPRSPLGLAAGKTLLRIKKALEMSGIARNL